MAFPPTVPPATRTDTTPQFTNHPGDHNAVSGALTDIINELGPNPSGNQATVQARLDVQQAKIGSGPQSIDWASADIGSKTAGTYDILSVVQPAASFPMRVFVIAIFNFGFGGAGSGTRVGFDIFKFSDSGVNGTLGSVFFAPGGTWSSVTYTWGWPVAVGQGYGFKLRGNITDAGGANCYLNASALYLSTNDTVF